MFLTRADILRGQVGGSWALEMESFLGPVKWHGADRRVPFMAQKTLGVFFHAPPPKKKKTAKEICQINVLDLSFLW